MAGNVFGESYCNGRRNFTNGLKRERKSDRLMFLSVRLIRFLESERNSIIGYSITIHDKVNLLYLLYLVMDWHCIVVGTSGVEFGIAIYE